MKEEVDTNEGQNSLAIVLQYQSIYTVVSGLALQEVLNFIIPRSRYNLYIENKNKSSIRVDTVFAAILLILGVTSIWLNQFSIRTTKVHDKIVG